MRISMLSQRKGNSGHFGAVVVRQLPSRCTITTPDIDYMIPRFDLRFLSHDIHQMAHRDLSGFLTADPEAMMHVFAPKLSVENI